MVTNSIVHPCRTTFDVGSTLARGSDGIKLKLVFEFRFELELKSFFFVDISHRSHHRAIIDVKGYSIGPYLSSGLVSSFFLVNVLPSFLPCGVILDVRKLLHRGIDGRCRNLNLGLMTKAMACKGAGQE